jgi:hypothetical protein
MSCIAWFRRVHIASFYGGFLAVVSGVALGIAGVEWAGALLFILGFILSGALLAESYLVLPFVRCPSCGHPFFVPGGWRSVLYRINPHRRTCVHCGSEANGGRANTLV